MKIHKYQAKVLRSKKRFILVLAGVQSGKTIIGSLWLLNETSRNSDKQYNYLLCAPTFRLLAQSTLKKFFEICPDLYQFYKKQDSVIEVPGKFTIYIRSAEEPKLLEGMTLKSAWLDEAGQMKNEVWNVIQGRLSIERGRCLITTTPYYLNWLYELCRSTNEDVDVIQFSSRDNPFFPQVEFERARSIFSDIEFARRYLGEFRQFEGIVFRDFVKSEVVVEPFDISQFVKLVGIDFGFNAPFVAIFIAKNQDNIYYVYKEYYKTQFTLQENIQAIKDLVRNSEVYPDPSRPDCIKELQLQSFRCYSVDNTIDLGIQTITKLLRQKRLKIFSTCSNLIEEFLTYHYKENSTKEEPEDINNDGLDALRYALHNYEKKLRIPEDTTQLKTYFNPITGYPELVPDAETLRERFGIYPLKQQIELAHRQAKDKMVNPK